MIKINVGLAGMKNKVILVKEKQNYLGNIIFLKLKWYVQLTKKYRLLTKTYYADKPTICTIYVVRGMQFIYLQYPSSWKLNYVKKNKIRPLLKTPEKDFQGCQA